MEILDRYLQAIRFWLPKTQQDDIVAEIYDDIQSQIGEEEAKLGRKLDEADIASMLKQRGNPLLVANRYLPHQSLIGPALFPLYRFVLKIVIFFYLVPWLLVWIGFMSFDAGYRSTHSIREVLLGGPGSFWFIASMTIGIVTISFAILERIQRRIGFFENWDPRNLPAVRDPNRIPRVNSIIELACVIVFVAWWLSAAWSPVIFDRAAVRIVLAPVWLAFFCAFLGVSLATMALSAVNLFRPYWTRLRRSVRLAIDCAGAVAVCWLFKAHLLVEISAPHLSSTRAAEIRDLINLNMSKSFPYAVAGCVLAIVLSHGGRFVRMRRDQTKKELTAVHP
jgi:hypothetical protein